MTAAELRGRLLALPAGTTFTRDAVMELLEGLDGKRCSVRAEELLTAGEAARRLGVTVDWMYRRTRTLPFARKLSRKVVRFSAEGLAEYIAAQNGR
ncbi:MAG TPA: helix-turn-helix domain-containing protein [Gemmatimonadales bacterium]|nr:helix-turn-helix domain-containing protein [Gemmatimonadales bacterium]